MNKTAKIILGIVIAIIVVVGAYFGVKYFLIHKKHLTIIQT